MSEPTALDRIWTSFRQLVGLEVSRIRFLGTYEYSCSSASGSGQGATVSGTPTDATLGLPDLAKIPIRSGMLGDSSNPSAGALVYVQFINGDPTRPCIVGASAVDSASIAGTLGNPAARLGDQVVSFFSFLPITITNCTITGVQAGAGVTLATISTMVGDPIGGLTSLQAVTGIINNGSAKVTVD